jgi:hypothetical protein
MRRAEDERDEFDEIFGRIEAGGQDYWRTPGLSGKGEVNHSDGGRGVYFQDQFYMGFEQPTSL